MRVDELNPMDERTSGTSLGHEDGTEGSGGGGGGGVEKGDGDRGETVPGLEECPSVELGVKSEEQGVAAGGEMEEKGKPVESRSLYHSIQQLSLPSSRSSGCLQDLATNKAPRLYKLADFVTQPNCRSTEEDDDEVDDGVVEMVSRSPHPRDPRGSDGWKGFDGRIKNKNTEEEFSELEEEEEDDDDEEFFRSSVRDVTDMSDDLSDDVEMTSYDGNASQTDDVGQFDGDPVPDKRSGAGSSSSDAGREEVRLEAKRARVENIIKTMTPMVDSASVREQFGNCRDFPPTGAYAKISGGGSAAAKKRKQYIPQQVDPRGGGGVNGGVSGGVNDHHPPAAKRERSAVRRSGLLRLEEEMVEMQAKYQEMLDREREISSFQMSDEDEDEVEGQGQGRMSSERSFFALSDVNQNDVKNTNKELLRRNYVIEDADSVRPNVTALSVLENLANVLKVEIAREVERLVDSYLGPFMVGDFRPAGGLVQGEAKGRAALRRKDPDHVASSDDVMINGSERRGAKSNSEEPVDQIEDGNDRRRSDDDVIIKDDRSEVVSPEVDDEPPLPVHEKRQQPTPLQQTSSGSNCHPTTNCRRAAVAAAAADIGSRLSSSLSHHPCLPIQFFPVRGFDRESTSGAAPDKCYFDGGPSRDAFGLTQPAPLSLFGSHHPTHPGLYYPPPCGVGGAKFPQGFLKDQDQMEPLPLIVGPAPKKAKRTKVIDRVSPRAMKPIPHEVQTPPDDEPAQPRPESPHHNVPIFHPSSRYHHTTGASPVHDAFSPHHHHHPQSLLQFGLAHQPVGLASPGFQQHSKFIQAMVSQMSSIGHGPGSSLLSPSHKGPPCSAPRDQGVPGSKSMIQKPIDFGAMTCSDAMMALPGHGFTSTLTPMHLRKAKLMFFYVRYPSSSILKVYFPDVKFNKNNTAQLVKWFSNFREFYYIQMEKYARQALAEGAKGPKELIVSSDSELYRILIVHYNRNCQIEIPENFRFVVQATLREFFTSIAAEKDQEPSWKKAIYKVIQRLDDPVPEYFKSPNWMERLVDG